MTQVNDSPLISFKRGPKDNLASIGINEGTIYVTEDTHEMYIDFNGERARISANNSYFAKSNSLSETSAKIANSDSAISDISTGTHVTVKFIHANEAANPTLNINNLGNFPITWNGEILQSAQFWKAGAVLEFVYIQNDENPVWEILGVSDKANTDEIQEAVQNLGLICIDEKNDGNIVITFGGITSAEGVYY